MADRNSSFVVSTLRPESLGGAGGLTYQLTVNSTNPTRVVGVDDAGMPVEESVPAAYSRMFVGLDGCLRDIPMRTGAGCSMEPEAERYEQVVLKEIVKAGVLPVEACPYTGQYSYITHAPSLVKIPDGERDCGGNATLIRDGSGQLTSGGCVHMQKVITDRKARARKKHDDIQTKAGSWKSEDVERMNTAMADSIGAAIGKHLGGDPAKANKARLRNGQGEAE